MFDSFQAVNRREVSCGSKQSYNIIILRDVPFKLGRLKTNDMSWDVLPYSL
jgi:hypothetical protein